MKNKRRIILILILLLLLSCAAAGAWFYKKDWCYIAQFPSTTNNQAMFYTIETRGKLIVVDGGWAEEAEYVKAVIGERGGHVDAWILTHPHLDHIGAFNAVMTDPDGITVDRIYTQEMDFESYRDRAHAWDREDVFEDFYEIISGLNNVEYLHNGDSMELFGLKVEVFNAYDKEITNAVTEDIYNDGSLMFKITKSKESMLFCADVGVTMSDTIIEEYGDKLKCDYIQMGHHGNGGLSEKFYRMTSPKAAFFDAPDWLMNPKDGSTYTTPQNREIMESQGARIYAYDTAPNQIRLR